MLGFEPRTGPDAAVSPAVLEEWWPEARRRVVRSLCASGVEPDAAEDAVAEAATRALAGGLVAEDIDAFCRWAFVVARNEVWMGRRRCSRLVPIDVVPERRDDFDIARHVETRQRLQEAVRLIGALSPADRGALLGAVTGEVRPADRKQAVKLAVRRHRARSRLRESLGLPVGWLGRTGFGRWTSWLGRVPPEALALAAAVPLFAVGAVVGTPSDAAVAAHAPGDSMVTIGQGLTGPLATPPARPVAHTQDTLRPPPARGPGPGSSGPPDPAGPLPPLPPAPEGRTSLDVTTEHNVDMRATITLKPSGLPERLRTAAADTGVALAAG